MIHFKITSAILSAVMCVSMLAAPVSVLADETPATSETQTEAAEKQETAETQKPAPKETGKEEPEVSEKKETEATEPAEEAKPSETEEKVPEEEEKAPEESEKQEPAEAEEKEPEVKDKVKASNAIIEQGTLNKIKWELSDKGVLTISGSGNINDDVAVSLSDKNSVKSIVFSGNGKMTIGALAFWSFEKLKSVKIPIVMPSITICTFLTLTNSFKLFDQNLSLTNGEPAKNTQMLALNIYETYYARSGASWKGIGQAKAVVFFLIVVVISLVQLRFTRSKEVQA